MCLAKVKCGPGIRLPRSPPAGYQNIRAQKQIHNNNIPS